MSTTAIASTIARGAAAIAIYATCLCFTCGSFVLILIFSIILGLGVSNNPGSGHLVDTSPRCLNHI